MAQTKISKIKNYPNVIDKVHESAAFRSYHSLNMVREMLERGDSHETILIVLDELENDQKEVESVKY